MPAKNYRQAPNWLRQRSIGKCQRSGEAQVSIDSMRRLQLESTLDGHAGCVNCLEWNWKGNLLASGSDDHNVIIWDPFKGVQRNLIRTGHNGNVFSVKFMPDFSDNLVATCASDGAVKVINVLANENVLNCLNCHVDRVKRLTVHPNEPHLVWSAGEDSFIMQYDIREPHTCKSTNNNPKNLLLDLRSEGGVNVAAKCLAINPRRDEMLAIGSNDIHIRLFDRRFMRQNRWDSCTTYFTPGHLLKQQQQKSHKSSSTTTTSNNRYHHQSFGTTYLAFSPDGSELLANMHAEQIYLFNTYEPWERYKSFDATVKPMILEQPTPITTDYVKSTTTTTTKLKPYAPWKELRKLFTCIELPTKHRDFYDEISEKLRLKTRLNKQELDKINELLLEIKNCVELYQLRAGALIQRAWRGDNYQAIRDCCCALALKPLDYQSLEYLALATSQLNDRESAYGLLEMIKLIQVNFGGLQEASQALSTCLRGYSRSSSASSWIDELQQFNSSSNDSNDVQMMTISPTDSHSDLGLASEEEEEGGDTTMVQQSDNNGLRAFYKLLANHSAEPNLRSIEAYDYNKRYCGHCNMNTDIKEANFFGYNGEFIVGGSDDGAFYIWDKETTNIVKAVHGDLQILNCVQPHPSICMLATSGIEPLVKLWSPSGRVCHDVKSLEVRCSQNQDFITSDPLEAMIMLLYPPQSRDI